MGIPKKPLAVSRAKKKLPVELDWGKGIPKDRLAYINADEEALIKRFRTSKAARDYAGIPAYADDSASSKGVERSGTTTGTTTTKSGSSSASSSSGGSTPSGQGGQNRGAGGPSGAGQGPNSSSSSSKSASSASSSSSSSKSTSSPSSTGGGGSKSPNAAAQAASNKLNGVSGAARPTTNASVSTGTSKAPNMAGAYAAQKLNATSNALKTAQQPKSIQGMINSGTATPWGGQAKAPTQSAQAAEKMVQDKWFNGQLGSLYKDPAINVNLPNALREGMWNQRISDSIKLAQDPNYTGSFGERTLAPWEDSGFRTKEQAAANAARGTGIKASFHNYGLAADIVTPGMPGYNDPNYKSWENDFARANQDLASNIPDSYGIKWGGDFGDPAHFQVGSGSRSNAIDTYGSNVTTEGIRPDGVVGPTASYDKGTAGGVGLAAAAPKSSPLQEALDSWNPPKPQGIPTPNGQTVASAVPQMQNYPQTPHFGHPMPPSGIVSSPLGPPQRDPAAARMAGIQQTPQPTVAGDPRVSMPPGSYPQSMPTMASSNPFGAINPVAAGRLSRLGTQIAVDDALSAPPAPIPNMRPPSQNMQPPAGLSASLPGFSPPGLPGNFRGTPGMAYNYSSPSTFSPEVGPGDEVAEDRPRLQTDAPVYSDNPMQGASNPMQEGENPQVTKDRQQKYASRGATIGGVIAGPLGTLIGGTLGWQMGKTPPRQRQAIASNPQALNANVQSINTMVEERGGKGNENMRVTNRGLKDVLENPAKVSANPQAYTTLEQMLAALAQGIDPETGKPIT